MDGLARILFGFAACARWGIALVAACAAVRIGNSARAAEPAGGTPLPFAFVRFLNDHCLRCHGEKVRKSGLRLDDLMFTARSAKRCRRIFKTAKPTVRSVNCCRRNRLVRPRA
jgi:hypothetical protein